MKIFYLFGLMILLLSSCNDTSGTYLISEVTFKDNNLSEQEKQETINEFLNREVRLTVLTGKVELVLSDKPNTSKITLQRTSNNYYSTTDGNITINLELANNNFVQTQYRLIEYGSTNNKFFNLYMILAILSLSHLCSSSSIFACSFCFFSCSMRYCSCRLCSSSIRFCSALC